MLAEVEVPKLQQNVEREKVQAQITVTQANAVRAEAQAERWNGVLPTTMVPGSAVPFVSLK